MLHRFRDIALDRTVQNRYIWLPLFGLTPRRRGSLGRSP